jgi:hypothetical protein
LLQDELTRTRTLLEEQRAACSVAKAEVVSLKEESQVGVCVCVCVCVCVLVYNFVAIYVCMCV